ncbi:MAG: hypothetical protein ABI925_11430 [Verrucomicrobiota bacterium]
MKWRLFTAINAGIALITLALVAVDLRANKKRRAQSPMTESERDRAGDPRRASLRDYEGDDITRMRVDQIGSAPPSELYQVLLRATPEQRAALAQKFDDLHYNAPTHSATCIFFQAWAELDGRSALQSALEIRDPKIKFAAINTVVNSISPYDSPELAEHLLAKPDEVLGRAHGVFLSALIARWAETDAPTAAKFLEGLKSDVKGALVSAGQEVAFSWATVDPTAAIAWVNQQQGLHVEGADTFLTAAVKGWFEADLEAASAYIASHADQPGVSASIADVTVLLVVESPDKAAKWVPTISSPEAREKATRKLAVLWADRDPQSAVRWFDHLSQEDQSVAVGGLAATWAELDFAQASKWIGGLKGDFRDHAIQVVIANVKDASPSATLDLAKSIESSEQRIDVIEGIIVQWAHKDPGAARAWITGSSLSETDKTRLLASSDPSQPSNP